jgi:serine/threonine-protein kinase
MKPAIQAGDRSRYSVDLLNAIDWALAPSEEARPQTAAELRNAVQRLTATPTSAQATIVVPEQSGPDPISIQNSLASAAVFDSETLRRIAAGLAEHIGPIASIVVNSAATKTATFTQLIKTVAAEIPNDNVRSVFVKAYSAEDKSAPAGNAAHSTQPRSLPSPLNSSPSRFDAGTLARAETELAKYIGAVAGVVVRRAAAKARDEAELYRLLADQIEDKNERKSFVRKANSVSGRK